MRKIFEDIKKYHDLIVGVIAALEAKDHPLASHSLRVSDMAEQICLCLNLPAEQTELIHMAAHVHDIGKIGIPDSVLLKKGGLMPGEWELIKQHPRIGAGILRSFEGLSEVADIILYHHERWDGKGYPEGIKKEQIPLGSRIIAVCDSIDAMLSDRPYKDAMNCEECQRELSNNSGVMYDPAVVAVVLGQWDQIMMITLSIRSSG